MEKFEKKSPLKLLAEDEGFDNVLEFLAYLVTDPMDVCNGICLSCGCGAKVEPDQGKGYCGECKENNVKSAFVLAGIM